MPVDPAFMRDLAGRLYGLLIGLEDCLDSDDASIIHQFIDARHCEVPVTTDPSAPLRRSVS